MISIAPSLRKAPFSIWFPCTRKRKDNTSIFLWFEERFGKAPFSWEISVDGRPNRRIEINLHFQISPAYGRCHVEKLFKEKKKQTYI